MENEILTYARDMVLALVGQGMETDDARIKIIAEMKNAILTLGIGLRDCTLCGKTIPRREMNANRAITVCAPCLEKIREAGKTTAPRIQPPTLRVRSTR